MYEVDVVLLGHGIFSHTFYFIMFFFSFLLGLPPGGIMLCIIFLICWCELLLGQIKDIYGASRPN